MTPAIRALWLRTVADLVAWSVFCAAYLVMVGDPLLDGPAYAALLVCTVPAGGAVGLAVGRQLVRERRRICPTCGGSATHEGIAHPRAEDRDPFWVRGCDRCLAALSDDAYLDVGPIED